MSTVLEGVYGVGRHVRLATTRTLRAYPECPFNLLDYLSRCSDAALFACVALARVSLLLLMGFSRTIAPVLFRAPNRSFVFDTGEELYDDRRFAMVRHWDGVHMFFAAQYGYLYENQLVFFPGLPGLIRIIRYVTQQALPVLHTLAPVSFYVCVLNVTASCLVGVFLRRLSILTFLGPEAVAQTCRWRSKRTAAKESGRQQDTLPSATAASAPLAASSSLERERQRITDATVYFRLLRQLTGTTLDAPLPAPPRQQPESKWILRDAAAEARRRRRAIGGAALMWILTPAMVFTVVTYTESLFALTTMLGIYWLAWYDPLPPVVQERLAVRLLSKHPNGLAPPSFLPSTQKREKAGAQNSFHTEVTPFELEDVLGEIAGGPQCGLVVRWRRVFTTRRELGAVLLFLLAATLRSNAFTCVGFLAFPLCVQLALPTLYAAQCRTALAGQRATALISAQTTAAVSPSTPSRSPKIRKEKTTPSPKAGAVVCSTLTLPCERFPHPVRILVVLAECVLIVAPYLVVNYVGYNRFVERTWSASAKAQLGHAFWQFYPALQKKYWNVSFLSAYTFTNFPNVILALPVALLIGKCTYTYYLAPAWAKATRTRHSAAATSLSSRYAAFRATLIPYLRSSNVVHLLALLTLALTLMHVQVTNRFVMSSPALYWLLGAQLAARPTSLTTQLTLIWSITWIIIGGVLFANHLPWT